MKTTLIVLVSVIALAGCATDRPATPQDLMDLQRDLLIQQRALNYQELQNRYYGRGAVVPQDTTPTPTTACYPRGDGSLYCQ